MQNNHAKAIRGLSIASLVVSAVIIVCCLVGAILMGVASSFFDANMFSSYYQYDLYGSHGGYYDLYDIYDDYADIQLVYAMIGAMAGVFVFCAILGIIPLAAAIIGMRNYNKPQKYGQVFAWAIAGAIVGFFVSGIVLTTLFILVAVFANIDKKQYQSGVYQVQVPGSVMPVQPWSPMPGQLGQEQQAPYGAQSQAPVQSQAQAQPTSSVEQPQAEAQTRQTQTPADQASIMQSQEQQTVPHEDVVPVQPVDQIDPTPVAEETVLSASSDGSLVLDDLILAVGGEPTREESAAPAADADGISADAVEAVEAVEADVALDAAEAADAAEVEGTVDVTTATATDAANAAQDSVVAEAVEAEIVTTDADAADDASATEAAEK